MQYIMRNWRDLQEVNIPPLQKTGFSQDVIIRRNIEPDFKLETLSIMCEEDEETVLCTQDILQNEDETVILGVSKKQVFTITRLRNGEKVEITGNIFVMGKASDCDYSIKENPTISRHHAQIHKVNGEYMLEDLKSANHTYVNGYEVREAVAISNNMIFTMSNEDFKVTIEIR